ncbi:deoxyguanosinetriphosphate triphosphohydrolase [Candidatus Soleaferrea massiliensis]|uniref:deoxyguanosinetriphosphate triphosphohydrolase n=1 Tax=Candidatus Soleaferrea massiliensis TaxID=1470354 RepID=UPI00058D76C5|nr:deoxyguanosinetriphosphate triphosphohydrolase [Candidatus Soleaferrea massiliensis]
MNIREQTQRLEHEMLSPRAAKSDGSKGRMRPQKDCDIRTCYQRDRDRILHCKSFRRLKDKTQVFLAPEGSHYRTRLTHTLEVSQIARTIARALRLNEDLTEAICLGHDLGHTPFGHAGERALDRVCEYGYRHNIQSVRVVHRLENDLKGLNLTYEVLNGIACHTTRRTAKTLEGRVVRFADKIAYLNHDFEDAVRGGILEEDDLPWDVKYILGRSKSARITALITSIIEHSDEDIAMDEETFRTFLLFRSFMFENVYTNPQAKGEEGKAEYLTGRLYEHFLQFPERLPPLYRQVCEQEGKARAVCDYISGMTDNYAIGLYEDIFIPRSWGGPRQG